MARTKLDRPNHHRGQAMIEHLLRSNPAVLPPTPRPKAEPGPPQPEGAPSVPRANTGENKTANLSTLEAKMATIPKPPVPVAPKPPTFSPGSESHLVTEYVLTGCVAACQRCLSCWYVESTWSDGSVDLRCYSCRATVTGELFPHLADERRAEKRRQREAEDAAIAGE
jgi:hypothetical protein